MKGNSFTIKDAVEFAVLHRNKGNIKCFEDWTRAQIAFAIRNAISVNGFAFATTPAGNRIAGIVISEPNHEKKTLHIKHVLGETGALKALIGCFKQQYEGYQITARRRGKSVAYRTDRLVQLAESNRN